MNTEPPQILCFPTHREKIWKPNNPPGQWLEQNIFRVSMPFVILGISPSPPPSSLPPPAEQIQIFLLNHSQSVPILENILGWEKLRPNVTTRTSREADFKGQHSGIFGIMTLKIGTCLTKKEAEAQDTGSQGLWDAKLRLRCKSTSRIQAGFRVPATGLRCRKFLCVRAAAPKQSHWDLLLIIKTQARD